MRKAIEFSICAFLMKRVVPVNRFESSPNGALAKV